MPDNTPSQSVPAPQLAGTVILLGIASLLNDISSEMIVPVLAVFISTLPGGSPVFLGLLEGAADSLASLLKLFSGPWSDRLQRRSGLVLLGYFLALITRPFIGMATAAWQIFPIRLADRFGKGIRTAPRDAMIADVTPEGQRGRAFGFHRAMDHIGAVIGPLFAALFLWFFPGHYQGLFLLALVPGVLVVVALVCFLREPERHVASEKPPFTLTLAPFDNNFRLYLFALVLFTLGNSSDLFLLAHAQKLGVPDYLLPILWGAFHIAKSAGNFWVGSWVDRIGPKRMILAGWLVYGVVYLLFGLAQTAWQIWCLFFAYAVFYALTEPSEKTLVASLVPPDRKGLAYGWFNFALAIATFPASLLFGWLYTQHPQAAFTTGAGFALAASLVMFRVDAGTRARRE
jgi:MFS family permease